VRIIWNRLLTLFAFCIIVTSFSFGQEADKEPVSQPPVSPLEVTFLNVGHGDCIYIDLPDRPDILYDDLLIDGGDSKRGAKALQDFLEKRKEDKVDLIFLTHAHSDHIGGLVKVLKKVNFDHLYYSGTDYSSRNFKKLMELAGDKKQVLRRGDEVDLESDDKEEVSLKVLNPPEGELSKAENDNSLVLLLTYGKERFLLTGDIEKKPEQELVEKYKDGLEAEVLKVPHHGSNTSSSEAFIEAVKPHYSVVSTDGKKYGLPKKEVLERYQKAGAEVLRTDEKGDITFLSTEDTLTLKKDESKESISADDKPQENQ
jgi:beta-lactamase superfamily II metal-dependent hydrolase